MEPRREPAADRARASRRTARRGARERAAASPRRARRAAAALVALAVCLGTWAVVAPAANAPRPNTLLTHTPSLASPGGPGSLFGAAVAMSADGSTAIVGAPTTGAAGAAYVYVHGESGWVAQGGPLQLGEAEQTCSPEEGAEGECRFGISAALSSDGDTAVIGEPRARLGKGAAWMFTRSGTTWTRAAELLPSDEKGAGRFGRAVALSADGTTVLVGGSLDHLSRGAAWVFTQSGSSWAQSGPKLTSGEGQEEQFGRSVALSADGTTALVGAPNHDGDTGAVFTFTNTGSGWMPGEVLTDGEPTTGERFGRSVALSENETTDETTALVGAPSQSGNTGAAIAFTRSGEEWQQLGGPLQVTALPVGSRLGNSVAISANGEEALLGASGAAHQAGGVFRFALTGATWTVQDEALLEPEVEGKARLGVSVALSGDGSEALAGAPTYAAEAGGVWDLQHGIAPPPSVSGIEPSSGTTEGGTVVTIEGSGFLPGATVTIGSQATHVEVLSENRITATTAAATAAGIDEVVVSDEAGTSTGGPFFNYVAPQGGGGGGGGNNNNNSNNNAGTNNGKNNNGNQGILSSTNESGPTPQVGKTGNLLPIAGHVRVKLPGSSTWTSVSTLTNVPFGTVVDATGGRVTVTTVGPSGKPQVITFYEGLFQLLSAGKGRVVAVLTGGTFASCPTAKQRGHKASAAAAHSKKVRKLWASGHGSYSTKGNYAAGAVQGTIWLTEDRCDGTVIKVSTDKVLVTDLVTHHHKLVTAHHQYFAKAP